MSLSNYLETELLDHIRGAAWTAPGTIYVQLHTGAGPDEDGVGNVGNSGTRQSVTFAAASGNSMASNADVTWTSVSDSTTYTYFSLWDLSSGGNCLAIGTLTANAVTTGDTFTISSGNLTFSLD